MVLKLSGGIHLHFARCVHSEQTALCKLYIKTEERFKPTTFYCFQQLT